MKIQNINNYMGYKGNPKAIKNEETAKAKKYDVIDIKIKAANDNGGDVPDIKKELVSQISEETKVDKINKIKTSLENNDYKIDVKEIVRNLLK
ncbi:MAG TPA: hypothetical protein DEF04_13240 [Clostridiales bacterium]|nr:hypothetical protein [Clostridiales bacterium]